MNSTQNPQIKKRSGHHANNQPLCRSAYLYFSLATTELCHDGTDRKMERAIERRQKWYSAVADTCTK